MTREWKPGDVAMRTSRNGSSRNVAIRVERCTAEGSLSDGPHWHFWGNASVAQCGSDRYADYRPLVVIDPEDRERVGDLVAALTRHDCMSHVVNRQAAVQSALRSLIEPPKPDEPTGLGAVVEDAEGIQWVRSTFADPGYYGWRCANRPNDDKRCWNDIAAVKILSDGVPS